MGKASRRKQLKREVRPPVDIAESVAMLEEYMSVVESSIPRWVLKLDWMRQDLPNVFPDCPAWCLLPIVASCALVEVSGYAKPGTPLMFHPGANVGSWYAWVQSKSVWIFDPDLAASIIDTDMQGHLPVELFYQLPEWAVYIQRPDIDPDEWPLAILGVLVHLDWNPDKRRGELRVSQCLHTGSGYSLPFNVSLALDTYTITEMVDGILQEAWGDAVTKWKVDPQIASIGLEEAKHDEAYLRFISNVISFVLYICSTGADIESPQDTTAVPKKQYRRQGHEGAPRQWNAGFRVSEALRRSRSEARDRSSSESGHGKSPVSHLRRAHWHLYWTGEGSKTDPTKRIPKVKWIAPTLVGSQADLLPVAKRVH